MSRCSRTAAVTCNTVARTHARSPAAQGVLRAQVLDKMGIPQLRALFLKTFNHPTGSNNAEWLRKKLAQPSDPQVGAARAAVPRARDVAAEIWTTGTTFKGFTKQERFKLQQMGGNCAAKVVEVIKDAPQVTGTAGPAPVAAPVVETKPLGAKRRKKATADSKMQVRVRSPRTTPVHRSASSRMRLLGSRRLALRRCACARC